MSDTHDTRELGDRLAPFSDAVVAIAITLLAIELPVPHGESEDSVRDSLVEALPDYAAFLGSFVAIAALWSFHHRLFRYVTVFSPRLVAMNFLWLLGIVLIPFATEVLVEDGSYWIGAAIYPAVVGFSGLMLFALTVVCQADGLLADYTSDGLLRRSQVVLGLPTAAFLAAVPLSCVDPRIATAVWVGTVVVTLIVGIWTLRPRVAA